MCEKERERQRETEREREREGERERDLYIYIERESEGDSREVTHQHPVTSKGQSFFGTVALACMLSGGGICAVGRKGNGLLTLHHGNVPVMLSCSLERQEKEKDVRMNQ